MKLLLVAVGPVLVVGAWYWWSSAGSSLRSIDESSFRQFTTQFQAAGGKERVLLLLSPT